MFYFENLLRNEYFPAELPPCFGSDSLADSHAAIQKYISSNKAKTSEPLAFSGYKNTNSRREYSIPNPLQYATAALVITKNSTDIFIIFDKCKNSLTVPLRGKPDQNEAYIKPSKKKTEIKEAVNKMYQNNLYEIRLDIQSFFDSIYTHSIAWAMHTKKQAKAKRNDYKLLGNQIDKCLRDLNAGQTNGILVGNEISRVTSEIILCSVDKGIKDRNESINYLRYRDDYFIYTRDGASISTVISLFRQELAKYGLMLNENKLQISEGPFAFEKPWVVEMRAFSRLGYQLLLEKAIAEYHKHKDISILRYALNVLRKERFPQSDWEKLQPLLFNIWVCFPILTNKITEIFKNNEKYVSRKLLKKTVNSILDTHLIIKNDEEIIWVLWICKVFNINLSQDYIKLLLQTENWLAIIILLDMMNLRKSESGIVKLIDDFRDRLVNEYFSTAEPERGMETDIWLLAYEADKNGWLNTDNYLDFDYARKHNFFSILNSNGVEFYNNLYVYQLISDGSGNGGIYVTKKELIAIIKKYNIENKTNLNPEKFEVMTNDEIDSIFEDTFNDESMFGWY
jgi:hypothetical protein